MTSGENFDTLGEEGDLWIPTSTGRKIMKVNAESIRYINERGNQVVVVKGQVDSDNQQTVLPEGRDYTGRFLILKVKGGSLMFDFLVEAGEPAGPVVVPVAELTREQQNEIFLKSQLKDPNLDPVSRSTVEQRLGITTEELEEGADEGV